MKHLHIIALMLTLSAALLLASCGGKAEDEVIRIEGMFRAEQVELDESFRPQSLQLNDGRINVTGYYGEDNAPVVAAASEEGWSYEPLPSEEMPNAILYTDSQKILCFRKYDETLGRNIYSFVGSGWEITGDSILDLPENYWRDVYAATRGDELIIAGDKSLAVIDSSGQVAVKLTLESQISKLYKSGEGGIFLICSESVLRLNEDYSFEPVDVGGVSLEYCNLYETQVGSICYANDTGVVCWTPEQGSRILMNWVSSGLISAGSDNLAVMDEDTIYLLGSDGIGGNYGLWRYTRVPEEEIPERQIISIGYIEDGRNTIPKAAIRYNRLQSDYYIRPVEYRSGDGNYEAAITRFEADIVAGKAGDIVCASTYSNARNYAEKGAFADLYELLDNPEDIFGCVRSLCELDGKLPFISQDFYMDVYICAEGDPVAEGGFGVSDFIEAEAQGRRLLCDMSRDAVGRLLLEYALYDCIDFDAGKCDFSSGDFRDLLEYLSGLPEEDPGKLSMYDGNHFASGEVAVYSAYTANIVDFAHHDYIFDRKGEIIDGTVSIGFGTGLYGITAGSKQKEGAADFLGFLISGEMVVDEMRGMQFLPSQKSTLDAWMGTEGEMYYFFYKDSISRVSGSTEPIESRPDRPGWCVRVDDELEGRLKDLLESIEPKAPLPDKLTEIAYEEFAAFFAGDKSADETIKLLNDRIGTYLAEQS